MFIPNKTYLAMRVKVLLIISTLLLVIAGLSVLYLKKVNEHNTSVATLSAQIDSAKTFDRLSSTKHERVNNQITDAVTSINKLQTSVNSLNETVSMLVRNECLVKNYYMDKKLFDLCSQ